MEEKYQSSHRATNISFKSKLNTDYAVPLNTAKDAISLKYFATSDPEECAYSTTMLIVPTLQKKPSITEDMAL